MIVIINKEPFEKSQFLTFWYNFLLKMSFMMIFSTHVYFTYTNMKTSKILLYGLELWFTHPICIFQKLDSAFENIMHVNNYPDFFCYLRLWGRVTVN